MCAVFIFNFWKVTVQCSCLFQVDIFQHSKKFHTKLVGIFLNAHNTKSHLSTSNNIILFETQITLDTVPYKCNS